MNMDFTNKMNEWSSGPAGDFIQNYRQALEDQYNADTAALANQRKLDHTTIMSGANRAGMLHSTFPTINKLKYDVGTYEPQLIKVRQGYTTGLDNLYNNVSKYYNQIKSIQEKIADLNEA